jgi:hypothetical protein
MHLAEAETHAGGCWLWYGAFVEVLGTGGGGSAGLGAFGFAGAGTSGPLAPQAASASTASNSGRLKISRRMRGNPVEVAGSITPAPRALQDSRFSKRRALAPSA